MSLKIACVSDVHGKYSFSWPRADLLIMAGDCLPNFSSSSKSADANIQGIWLEDHLIPMLTRLRFINAYKNIVLIPGNHDRVFQMHTFKCRELFDKLHGVYLLIDEEVKIKGKKIYGSPWTPWFGGQWWAYNFPDPQENKLRARAHARNCWKLIPTDTDILVTHGPPFSVLDLTITGKEAGCPHLADEVFKRVKPALHVFGHIHESSGECSRDGIKFVNAAIVNLKLQPTNPPKVVTI